MVVLERAVDWRIQQSLPKNDWRHAVDLDEAHRQQDWPPKRKRRKRSAAVEDSSGESPEQTGCGRFQKMI